MSTTIVSKLSLKSLKAQPAKNALAPGETRDVAMIYGRTNKCEIVPTGFGDSTRFSGSFEGVNLATGEKQKSARAFLPGIVEDLLAEAVAGLDEGAFVDFGFIVGVQHSEKGNMGYAYTVRPVVELKESDELGHLRNLAENELRALPAPEAKPAKGKK